MIARELGLGIRLLVPARGRLIAAFLGIGVAIVVMFVELGLLVSVLESQALMASIVHADLVVLSSARTNLHKWNDVDPIRLFQIAGLPDVARVTPLYQSTMILENADDGGARRIVVLAFPADDVPIAIGDAGAISAALKTGAVLYDRRSRAIYGDIAVGHDVKLDGNSYRVGGFVDMGPDVVNDGAIVMSEGLYRARNPGAQPIMGAITLAQGVDIAAARARIAAALPDDIDVFTPQEVRSREIEFTLRSAPIGILFGIGMLAGLVIGSLTCYQILFNEIVDRLPQYATLKAMGFSNLFLKRVILEQAILLTSVGFAGGIVVAWVLYGYIARQTALALRLSIGPSLTILAFAVSMAVIAGLLALRRVETADPAELY